MEEIRKLIEESYERGFNDSIDSIIISLNVMKKSFNRDQIDIEDLISSLKNIRKKV